MTDEQYTIKEIEAAILPDNGDVRAIIARLRAPKTKFAAGQVVSYGSKNHNQYCRWNSFSKPNSTVSALDQTEVGPDWVKREPAMKLWEVADKIYSHIDNGGKLDSCTLLYDALRDALNNFDAETSDA